MQHEAFERRTHKKRNVLVTGSSRGIGFGIAEAFAKLGDNVVLNCIKNETKLSESVEALRSVSDGTVEGYIADVSDYWACKTMFGKIFGLFGHLDVLVNNAGKEHFGLFQDMDKNTIDEISRLNLNAVLYPAHIVLPSMIRQKSGVIINISSVWGISGASCETVYSAAKAGVIGFTKSLAKELAPSGIRVNVIACGAFETRMNERLSVNEKEMFLEDVPLGRFGNVQEAGALAVFLASEGAGYITGQVINLDGGFL